MKYRYEIIVHAAGQLLAEGGNGYTRPDFNRLLSIVLRMLVEVVIGLHMMRRAKMIDEESYHTMYSNCEEMRKLIVRLKGEH